MYSICLFKSNKCWYLICRFCLADYLYFISESFQSLLLNMQIFIDWYRSSLAFTITYLHTVIKYQVRNTLLNMDKLFIRSVLWCFSIPEQKAIEYTMPTVLVYCRTLTCFLWAVMYSEGIHNCQSSVSLVPSQLLSAALPCSLTTLVTFCGEINVLHSKQESCSDQQKCKIISSIYLHTSIVSYTPGMTGWFFFCYKRYNIVNLRLDN